MDIVSALFESDSEPLHANTDEVNTSPSRVGHSCLRAVADDFDQSWVQESDEESGEEDEWEDEWEDKVNDATRIDDTEETDYEDEEEDTPAEMPEHTSSHTPTRPSPYPKHNPSRRARKACKLVIDVLDYIKHEKKSTLAAFLKEFSWGEHQCKKNCDCHHRISRYRTEFFKSKFFPEVVDLWCKPPRVSTSKRSRPMGGRRTLIPAAEKLMQETFKKELSKLDPSFRGIDNSNLTRSQLTSISIPGLITEVKTKAPRLWDLLSRLGTHRTAGRQGTSKDISMVR